MRAFQKAKIEKAQDTELLKEVEKHAKNFAKLASEGTMSTLLPSKGMPDTEQASAIYQAISVIMKRYGFCITNFNEIHLTKSCIPRDWDVHPTMITNVKFALFERIQAMIPFDNKEMHKMLKPYALTTDGYGLLYSIMIQSIHWMTTNKGGWCTKPWDSSKSH